MKGEPSVPETPDDDLTQDPGIPAGAPAPEPERDEEGSLERPDSPDDPRGIDAPDSPHVPAPQH
jgi:hypothetical protein